MKTENSQKPAGAKNKEQGARSKDKGTKNFSPKYKQEKKDADGDLQEKLAKLKGMFK